MVYWRTLYILFVLQTGITTAQIVTQEDLNDISRHLEINIDVVENFDDGSQHKFRLLLNNKATTSLAGTNWKIYFYSFFIVESKHILSEDGLFTKPEGYVIGNTNIRLRHENGCLFSFSPTGDFQDLPSNGKREITFFAANWAVSKTDIPPNWYITAEGLDPRVFESTKRNFVGDFTEKKQWKRMEADQYNPYTSSQRYNRYKTTNSNVEQKLVIPTPNEINNYDPKLTLNMADNVTIVHVGLDNEAAFLSNKTQFDVSDVASSGGVNMYLLLSNTILTNEGYTLIINPSLKEVNITGRTSAGVFYGIQTLLSLLSNGNELPKIEIKDQPRFDYRGMHVDLARNFIPKMAIYKLMDVMSMYKMNKLHLHLTDDEGWRIEIEGLPELTKIGSKRCQTTDGDVCLIPQLGSGPDTNSSGSGYLTVQDYKDILNYAKVRHIEIIPEIDMPGHARAAIMAMEARYRTFNGSGQTSMAEQYRLVDPLDDSKYLSVQNFNDNAINPCIESTYSFIEKVVKEIKNMHDSVGHSLNIFHFGGDEVSRTAWTNSTVCMTLNFTDLRTNLKRIFTERVANITLKYGLNLAGWEDGFVVGNGLPFDRKSFLNTDVFSNAWDNVWEWGEARRAYNYANAGYKVIMSHGTHLYFDHPYEPDPEERGLYWATRFTDSIKTFGFLPDSLYENIDVTRMGVPLDKAGVCGVNNEKCPALEIPENIVGMQGQLWSETVLSEDNFYYMVFPRVLALAERAWHKAAWESVANKNQRAQQMKQDWDNFAHALGHKELNRLDDAGIKYRLPPPGATKEGDAIQTNSAFPGLVVEHSADGRNSWKSGNIANPGNHVYLRTRSTDGSRFSRVVQLALTTSSTGKIQATMTIFVTVGVFNIILLNVFAI